MGPSLRVLTTIGGLMFLAGRRGVSYMKCQRKMPWSAT